MKTGNFSASRNRCHAAVNFRGSIDDDVSTAFCWLMQRGLKVTGSGTVEHELSWVDELPYRSIPVRLPIRVWCGCPERYLPSSFEIGQFNFTNGTSPRKNSQWLRVILGGVANCTHWIGWVFFWVTLRSWIYVWCLICLMSRHILRQKFRYDLNHRVSRRPSRSRAPGQEWKTSLTMIPLLDEV